LRPESSREAALNSFERKNAVDPQFMPQFAPFVVLAFLGACFVLVVTLIVSLASLLWRKWKVSKLAALAACAVAVGYLALLLGASVTSQEQVLTSSGKKYFCQIDCHIAYSIEGVTTAKTLGAPLQLATASGRFYVIRVKTWFDENTISPRRGNGPLQPNPRRVGIVDNQGREYEASPQGLRVLQHNEPDWTPLTQPLRPGESYITTLVFDLPDAVRNPRLFITDAVAVTHLLIGHENSLLHKRIYFRLEPQPGSAAL
jgi:hypothetical protein